MLALISISQVVFISTLFISGKVAVTCYHCRYDSSVPSTKVCMDPSSAEYKELSIITCDGMCVIDHVKNEQHEKEIFTRTCEQTTNCHGNEEMRYVIWGYGTRKCCPTDLCNTSHYPSPVVSVYVMCLVVFFILHS